MRKSEDSPVELVGSSPAVISVAAVFRLGLSRVTVAFCRFLPRLFERFVLAASARA